PPGEDGAGAEGSRPRRSPPAGPRRRPPPRATGLLPATAGTVGRGTRAVPGRHPGTAPDGGRLRRGAGPRQPGNPACLPGRVRGRRGRPALGGGPRPEGRPPSPTGH